MTFAVVLAACDDKEPNPYGGVLLADAPREIAKAVCPRAYQCCMQSQLSSNDLAGTDEASCEAKTTEGFRNSLNVIITSQEKGRVVYRGDKLAACLAYIRSASCQDLNRTNHFTGLQCEPYTEPKVSAGGACGQDFECIGGFCDKQPMQAEGLCKTGEPPPPPNRAPGPAAEMCFYSSSCSYGEGRGRPAGAGLSLLVAGALVMVWRRRSHLR